MILYSVHLEMNAREKTMGLKIASLVRLLEAAAQR